MRGRIDERGWVDGNRRQERVTGRENAIIRERATGTGEDDYTGEGCKTGEGD